jgi:hypothetical protein
VGQHDDEVHVGALRLHRPPDRGHGVPELETADMGGNEGGGRVEADDADAEAVISSKGSSPRVRFVRVPVKMSPASKRKERGAARRSRSTSVASDATPPRWWTSVLHHAGIGSNALSKSLVKSRVTSRASEPAAPGRAEASPRARISRAGRRVRGMDSGPGDYPKKTGWRKTAVAGRLVLPSLCLDIGYPLGRGASDRADHGGEGARHRIPDARGGQSRSDGR